jgi:hypothetical protein
MRHRQMDPSFSQDIQDIYNICMNKNYLTRPFASDLLGLEEVQKWAKELNIMNVQLLRYSREKNRKTLS